MLWSPTEDHPFFKHQQNLEHMQITIVEILSIVEPTTGSRGYLLGALVREVLGEFKRGKGEATLQFTKARSCDLF